jgi:hypothetical protein
VHAIRPDYERRKHRLSFHDQPHNTSILDKWRFDSASCANADAASCGRLRIEDMIQHLAALPYSRLAETNSLWKIPFHRSTVKMISNTPKARSAHGISHLQAIQNCHASGHQPFTARLFPRELRALEQLNRKTPSSEHNRQ